MLKTTLRFLPLLLLFSFVAFAQDGGVVLPTVPGVEAQPAPSIWSQLWGQVAGPLTVALGSILVVLSGFLTRHVAGKASQTLWERALSVLVSVVNSVVLEIDATFKPKLAEFMKDGVLSAAEALELKTLAITMVKEKLAGWVLRAISANVGPSLLDTFIGGKIEAAVDQKNLTQASAKAAAAKAEALSPQAA